MCLFSVNKCVFLILVSEYPVMMKKSVSVAKSAGAVLVLHHAGAALLVCVLGAPGAAFGTVTVALVLTSWSMENLRPSPQNHILSRLYLFDQE